MSKKSCGPKCACGGELVFKEVPEPVIYKMECLNCGKFYSSKEEDIPERKCPFCQDGAPSEPDPGWEQPN